MSGILIPLRLGLLLHLLILRRFVMTYGASDSRSGQSMMSSHVSDDSAGGGARKAPRFCAAREPQAKHECKECGLNH